MTRNCTQCKTPIRTHALVIDGSDFHRKSCFCEWAGHKLEGDKRRPKGCRDCEPVNRLSSPPNTERTRTRQGRKPRSVMIVS